MSGIFDRYYKKYDSWYERNRYAYLSELALLRKVIPEKEKGLEVGVGTGRFASALGIDYGIDPSINMLKIARSRGVKARSGRAERLPYKAASFDYLVFIITLCFLKDKNKALSEARRVLRKNGKIIIAIVDKDSFLGKFYRRKKSVFYKQAEFLSVGQVKRLLKSEGFGGLSYYQTVFRAPEAIRKVELTRRGFGRGGFVVIKAKKEYRPGKKA